MENHESLKPFQLIKNADSYIVFGVKDGNIDVVVSHRGEITQPQRDSALESIKMGMLQYNSVVRMKEQSEVGFEKI